MTGGADHGWLQLNGSASAALLTDFSIALNGAAVFLQLHAYFRGPGNGVRPYFSIRGQADDGITAFTQNGGYIGASAAGTVIGASTTPSMPEFDIDLSSSISILNTNQCEGPIAIAGYPGVEYWRHTGVPLPTPLARTVMGYYSPQTFAEASAQVDFNVFAWLEGGQKPEVSITSPSNGAVLLPSQLATHQFVGIAQDPDNPGSDPWKGIIQSEWLIEQYDGTFLSRTGRSVDFAWPTERRTPDGSDVPYRVIFSVVDDEGMRNQTEISVSTRGPVPEIHKIERFSSLYDWFTSRLSYRYYVRLDGGAQAGLDLIVPWENLRWSPAPPSPWNPDPLKWKPGQRPLGGWPERSLDSVGGRYWFVDTHGQWTQPTGSSSEFESGAQGVPSIVHADQWYSYNAPWLDPQLTSDQFPWFRGDAGPFQITHELRRSQAGSFGSSPTGWELRISKHSPLEYVQEAIKSLLP